MADSDEENEDLTMYDEEAKFDMFGNLITQDHHMPTMEDEIALPDYKNTQALGLLKSRAKKKEDEELYMPEKIYGVEQDSEGLGDNFHESIWRPPDISDSLTIKQHRIYMGGEYKKIGCCGIGVGPVRTVDVTDDLGESVPLYFQFAKSFSVCFLIMSFLSLPSLIFAYSGIGISDEDKDSIGLYQLTIGNINNNNNNKINNCKRPDHKDDTNCIDVLGLGISFLEFSMSEISAIITITEILSIVVFFITIKHLDNKLRKVEKRNMKQSNLGLEAYTVLVTNLPKEFTLADLIVHFSSLYYLDSKDRFKRPPIKNAKPLQHCEYNDVPLYRSTWIVNIHLNYNLSKYFNAYISKQKLFTQLYRTRALYKMSMYNTPHKKGANKKRELKASKQIIKYSKKIDIINKQLQAELKKDQSLFDGNKTKKVEVNPDGTESKPPNTYQEGRITAAFVTFNYNESMVRCIEDYEFYNRWYIRWIFHPALKFKGYKLQCTQAPPPEDVIWQSIEVSSLTRLLSRIRSGIVIFILVLVSFVIMRQSALLKKELADSVPGISMCNSLPMLYTNGSLSSSLSSSLVLTRPVDSISLDTQCEMLIPGSFYAVYMSGDKIVGDYALSACNNVCPDTFSNSAACPCISLTDTTTCKTYACSTNSSSPLCEEFAANTIGSCYCKGNLVAMLAKGVSSTISSIQASKAPGVQADVCQDFMLLYSSSQALTYVIIVIVLIINFVIFHAAKYFSYYDYYYTYDDIEDSKLKKTFFALFFNIVINILINFGNCQSIYNFPSILADLRILSGPYTDFDNKFYGNVTVFLLIIFFFQSFSSIIYESAKYNIFLPLLKGCLYTRIQSHNSKSIYMQYDLDMIELGPIFQPNSHTSLLLVSLFIAMPFACGIPIFMPLSAAVFITYFRNDKKFLLRYYQQPYKAGNKIMKKVISLLPFAGIIRLAFGIWMLSNSDIFDGTIPDYNPNLASQAGAVNGAVSQGSSASGAGVDASGASSSISSSASFISTDSYLKSVTDVKAMFYAAVALPHYHSLFDRAFQPNTFPLTVILILILLVEIIKRNWRRVPVVPIINGLLSILASILNTCRGKKVYATDDQGFVPIHQLHAIAHPARTELAPFTDGYFKFVRMAEESGGCFRCCRKKQEQQHFKNLEEIEAELQRAKEEAAQAEKDAKARMEDDEKARSSKKKKGLAALMDDNEDETKDEKKDSDTNGNSDTHNDNKDEKKNENNNNTNTNTNDTSNKKDSNSSSNNNDNDNDHQKHEAVIRTKGCLCCKEEIEDLSLEEEEGGWELIEKDGMILKVKLWKEDASVAGSYRPKGTMKRTYDILNYDNKLGYAPHQIPFHVTQIWGLDPLIREIVRYKQLGKLRIRDILYSVSRDINMTELNQAVIIKGPPKPKTVWDDMEAADDNDEKANMTEEEKAQRKKEKKEKKAAFGGGMGFDLDDDYDTSSDEDNDDEEDSVNLFRTEFDQRSVSSDGSGLV